MYDPMYPASILLRIAELLTAALKMSKYKQQFLFVFQLKKLKSYNIHHESFVHFSRRVYFNRLIHTTYYRDDRPPAIKHALIRRRETLSHYDSGTDLLEAKKNYKLCRLCFVQSIFLNCHA